ncbi:MAG: helix-turn-helix domain-containing protein [Clostridia bacterium]|nr:helix-turn-helix domain-containing protein [Clostridia bacterium]
MKYGDVPIPGYIPCYSIPQVAAALGISVSTIRRLIRNGKLAAFRIGRQWRISLASLQQFTGANLLNSNSIFYSDPAIGLQSLYDEYLEQGFIASSGKQG